MEDKDGCYICGAIAILFICIAATHIADVIFSKPSEDRIQKLEKRIEELEKKILTPEKKSE